MLTAERSRRAQTFTLLFAALAALCVRGEDFDVLILGGGLVDGSGGTSRMADAGIRGNRNRIVRLVDAEELAGGEIYHL